jgi:L-iditol 2-dehydrogenase
MENDLMTVAACAGGGAIRLEARPRPQPGPGEIRLRLRCAGLCGTDLFKLHRDTAAPGSVLGHEVVGTVDAVGDGAKGFAVGDRVVVPHHVSCGACALCRRGAETLCPVFRENLLEPGGFSEYILVRERAVRLATFGIPDSLSDATAVFLEPAACVLRGIRHARLAETAALDGPLTVAVLGAGSMGLLHLLVLKAVVPSVRVMVVDPLEDRRAFALLLGADAAAEPVPDAAWDAVASLTEGRGADAVFDTVGGVAALDAGLTLSREGGTTVLFAHATSEKALAAAPAALDLNRFFKAEKKLLATYSGALAEQREVWRLLVTRRFDPSLLVTHRLPLARLAEAVDLARERRALKILLTPEAEAP